MFVRLLGAICTVIGLCCVVFLSACDEPRELSNPRTMLVGHWKEDAAQIEVMAKEKNIELESPYNPSHYFFAPPDDNGRGKAMRCSSDGTTVRYEYQIIAENKDRGWVKCKPHFPANGDSQQVVKIAFDGMKRAERASSYTSGPLAEIGETRTPLLYVGSNDVEF